MPLYYKSADRFYFFICFLVVVFFNRVQHVHHQLGLKSQVVAKPLNMVYGQ
jgi:hypothetical protein